MKNKIININKNLVKRKKFLKEEVKKIILKSILQNLNIKPKIRAKALNKLSKNKKKSFLSKQKNNICLKSGRIKGVYKKFSISRHMIKFFAKTGDLQNTKIKNW